MPYSRFGKHNIATFEKMAGLEFFEPSGIVKAKLTKLKIMKWHKFDSRRMHGVLVTNWITPEIKGHEPVVPALESLQTNLCARCQNDSFCDTFSCK